MNKFDDLLLGAVSEGIFPGACYGIWCNGKLTTGAVGNHTYEKTSPQVNLATVWDLASLSKVVATTTATMILVESGQLDLDHPVALVLPEFAQNGKDQITFRNLMIHDSGLVAFRPYHLSLDSEERVMDTIYKEKLTYETGTQTVYSDLSMILVAKAIEQITNSKLDDYVKTNVFTPLGMNQTGYFRHGKATSIRPMVRSNCAPTEEIEAWRTALRLKRYGEDGCKDLFGKEPHYIQGEVHDPTATVLDGVAGHAGLFSTVEDLCLFMTSFMTNSQKLINSEVFSMFTTRQSTKSTRALGWDTKSVEGSSAGSTFGSRSFGHTGYTGTSIWCDPEAHKFSILLTNRVHPTSKNTKIIGFRAKFNEQT